jgi:hypothetical protein
MKSGMQIQVAVPAATTTGTGPSVSGTGVTAGTGPSLAGTTAAAVTTSIYTTTFTTEGKTAT